MAIKTVRCGNNKATPYLRQHIDLFTECVQVVDIACGNGRNSEYLKDLGMDVISLDAKDDYGITWLAGQKMPVEDGAADMVLCNYLLMFLDNHARNDVYKEIDRISDIGTRCMIELEQAKQSLTPDPETLHALNDEVCAKMLRKGWRSIHGRKNHYIFEKIEGANNA